MKEKRLLNVLGYVDDRYIEELDTPAAIHKHTSPRRVWLIAAVVAVALLLVGCVAYVLSLDELVLGTEYIEDYRTGETEPRIALSLQGYAGSNGYMAAQEWFEWERKYDPDLEILMSIDDKNTGIPEEYISYNCYTQEMKDKVDEICNKYNLDLLGQILVDTTSQNMFDMLHIGGILRQDAQAKIEYSQGGPGYFFQNGSFKVECYMTLTGDNNPWPYENLISFRCHNKKAFDDVTIGIDDISKYEQWNYTTSYGVETLLVKGEESAFIVVDIGDYFITVIGIDSVEGNILDGLVTMPHEALEAYAEALDFTICPQPLTDAQVHEVNTRYDSQWAKINGEQKKEDEEFQEYLGRASYEARVSFHLKNDTEAVRMGYAFYDFDRNGVEELVIGRDGYIQFIYTESDGETAAILGWPQMGNGYAYLTEDGSLVYEDGENIHFFHVEVDERVTDFWVEYRPYSYPEGESPWRFSVPGKDEKGITEQEYNEYISSPKRIVLDMTPLTEYPLTEPVEYNTDGRDVTYYDISDTYEELIRDRILNPVEWWNGELLDCRYALLDLDGDGQDELIMNEAYYMAIYTMADGKMVPVYSGEELNICKRNVIEIIHTYPRGNKAYCYYQMSGNTGKMIEYLRYDADKFPDNPWLRSSDASGQDKSMIPVTKIEFDAIRGRYEGIKLDWKSVSEYPLD